MFQDGDDGGVGDIKQLVALKFDLRSFLRGIQIFCEDFSAEYLSWKWEIASK